MINKEQVQHIAKLARIELTEEEEKKFTKELSSILDYVEQLRRVNTDKVERIAQITGLKDIVRKDEQSRNKIQDTRYKLLKNVPKKKGNFIQVPKILE